jgi:cation diffusion facilitator CzcD-associated flavoprotein CzcO
VVVVGYGKSACDIAEAVSQVATSTTVVARRLLWKMPHRIRGIGAAEDHMTRLGEASFHYIEPNRFERLYNGRGRRIRDAVFDLLQWRVSRQLGLSELGLVPEEDFERIARSNASMVTDGFYEQVAAGRITVHYPATIARLGARAAVLSTGQSPQADIVLCATGFRQWVPFLDHAMQDRLVDGRGNFRLYRQVLPVDIPHLTFAGYNSSQISSLNAEIGAVWTVGFLTGNITLPSKEEMVRHVERRLRWMEHRTMGHHAAGTSIIPFSIHNIDELLADLSIDIAPFTRARQWVRRIQPQSYQQHIDRFTSTCGRTNPHAAPAVA